MSDLIERLRESYGKDVFLMEAADRIEELEAEIERIHDSCAELRDVITKKCVRIEKLEAELNE